MNASWVRFVVRWIVAASLFSAYCGGSAMAAPFTPLPLTTGANSGFSDEEPEDRRGGWLDLGAMIFTRSLRENCCFRVPFEILDETATGGKSCIVLGGEKRPHLPSSAKVAVEEKQGDFLLSASRAAWCPPLLPRR